MHGMDVRGEFVPWSLFVPVALAVVVGVLVAGWIQRGLDRIGDDPAPVVIDGDIAVATDASHDAPPGIDGRDEGEPASAPAPAVADTAGHVPAEAPPPAPVAGPSAPGIEPVAATDTVPALPGAIIARRDGAPEACINGTIAMRDANGWQQRLENDAPVACTEQAVAPPPR